MALDFFRLEKGIHITSADSDVGITILKAAAAPSNTADENAAERGSVLYAEDGSGIYYKDTAGSGANKWVKVADHAYIASVLGITEGDLNFGTFTGTLLTDNQSAKALFQILETEVEALRTLSGTAAGATDLGTFTGSIIPDNSDIKEALQSLETYTESIANEVVEGSSAAITTAVVVDEVLVDNINAAKWFVVISLDSAPERKVALEVFGLHDGTASADATLVDNNVTSKLKLGTAFNYTLTVELDGTGATQKMQLKIAASGAVSASFTRLRVM